MFETNWERDSCLLVMFIGAEDRPSCWVLVVTKMQTALVQLRSGSEVGSVCLPASRGVKSPGSRGGYTLGNGISFFL